MIICPKCGSDNIVKNGSIHNGKQKFKCKNCQRQFVDNNENKQIPVHIKQIIDKLLLERISLAGICRATGVSNRWLYLYIRDKYVKTSRKLKVSPKKKGKITIQLDELWSFVDNKGHKQWVWVALDVKTREIVGLHIGDRSQKSARALWDSLPAVYRQCAVCYTDFLDAYQCVLPTKRHRPSPKWQNKLD